MDNQLNVLVTGGAGFIGSRLVEHLSDEDRVKSLIVFDNFSSSSQSGFSRYPNVRVINGDIQDCAALALALKNVDLVFHLAGDTWKQRAIEDPTTYREANINGTMKVLEAARNNGARRFIFASSCAVYGNQSRLPISEAASCSPATPYAHNKAAGEALVKSSSESYSMECITLRLFNVYGKEQIRNGNYGGLVAQLFQAALNKRPVTIYGTGNEARDYVHITDVVEAFCLAGLSYKEQSGHQVFNIGSGIETTVAGVITILQELIGSKISVEFAEPRLGEIKCSVADITKAVAQLNYHPSISLPDGIARIWQDLQLA